MTVFGFVLDWKILLALISILLAAAFLLYRLFQYVMHNHRSLERFLARQFSDVMLHPSLPDSMGGKLYIDFLALDMEGIHIISYKDYPGLLFGGEKIDQWTQVVGSKSYRFDNPFYHNQLFMNELGRLIQGIPLKSVLVFSDQGEFPRGKPENVYLCREYRESFQHKDTSPVPDAFLVKWSSLKKLMEPD